MIKAYRGVFHTEFFAKKVSTEFTDGDLVYVDSDGYLAPMTATTDQHPIGIIQKTIASTDSDYASATRVPVLVGDHDAEYTVTVGTGTAATTDIGEWCDADDTNPETSLDVTASAYDIWYVTGVINTALVIAKMQKTDPRPDSIVD